MPKHGKFLALILSALVLFTVYVSLLPAAHAAEPSFQEKSLSVLSDVVGLKTEQYTISKSSQREDTLLDFPQQIVDLHLTSAGSTVRVTCSYVKDTLQTVYISDLEDNLKLKQPAANTVDMAKSLLSSYQRESGNAVYGEFASMLNGVVEGESVAKVVGDVKLEVSSPQQNTSSYMWTYVDANGVVAEKKNVILTYESGMLKAFYNNWALYIIADTVPKLSAQDATKLAIEASKNFSYTVTDVNGTEISVSGFSIAPESLGYAKLIYVNSKEQVFARGGDPYRMYLAWHVPLGFDRFYPGDVSGLTVILWADTGEVCGMDRVILNSRFALS
jgi:hypothetical protein